ncbi:MAG: 3D-(3,5/4)-trihydroxycyclohexane-1,2-dione acylhydrolase (decyclizing) [Burkholderiales bacterium]
MKETVRLTMAQALVRKLASYRVEIDGKQVPYCAGVWAIFGHGNVAGVGEALYAHRDVLPTYRAHNEQAMAHAAIAFAKAHFRRRMMAATTSIGPGATNLVTAAALAHVNRLPVLFLPGDIFASRAPDPVLQQVEDFHDGGISANDCLKPVSRYFDRIVNPEQLLTALPRAVAVLTDPALCGPVTLALPQDVQAEAYDFPGEFFENQLLRFRATPPDPEELGVASALVRGARRPLLIAGGGVLYSPATGELRGFVERHDVPVAETQAGKSAVPWDHPLQMGSIGVTGSPAANALAREADLVLAVGTRLQDFTTGSHALFPKAKVVSINVNPLDASRLRGAALVADAAKGLEALSDAMSRWRAEESWTARAKQLGARWRERVGALVSRKDSERSGKLPYDADVIGAVQRSQPESASRDIVVCASGTLPAELHKLWRAAVPGGYHMEYGYSCMGYEIAGGLGVKLARPQREVIVLVGDGSYLMLNSELATSMMLGLKLIVVVLDNRGYGCINRLQRACGGAPFNNLLKDCLHGPQGLPQIDFAAHASSLGCIAEHPQSIAELEQGLERARSADRTTVLVIDTDPDQTTDDGGAWWEVGVPEVSERETVRSARAEYEEAKKSQRI